MADGTANERHERGWFLGADGVWRAYDGLSSDPLLDMCLEPHVLGIETVARMRELMAENPNLRAAS